MRKGKKVYILEIWFDDNKGEIISIQESCELANNEVFSNIYIDDETDVPVISLCDYIDDKWMDLISEANVIGLA